MGYLSLDANDRSGFQARELKSVYVDSPALLLKLIFHKCHLNNFNVFNQIGLIALNCIGSNNPAELDGPAAYPQANSQQGKRPTQIGASTDFDSLDPEIAQKLRILDQIKEKAVAQERFDDAKKIKENIERLRGFGLHL